MKTRLLIKPDNLGWTDIDLYEDILIPLTFQVSDVKDLSKKNTNFSKSFEVPCTENNMQLFKKLNIAELTGSVPFGKKLPCKILHDGIDVISGVIKLEKVNKEDNTPISYTLQVNSEVKSFIDTINDLTFEDIDWTGLVVDSSDMSPVNINNIWYGLDWYDQFDRGIGVALIDRINNIGSQVDYWRTKDLSPFIYANKILDKIITQAGYKWESMFFRHHFDGTWDTFNDWIVGATGSSFNYPVREVRNVGKFDSRQFVIPSQIDPNNWEWSKVIPSNQIVDTYITRRDSSDDEQRYVYKSSTSQSIIPAMEAETTSNTFFSTDSNTNTYYKLPKVKADGSVDETAGLQNYVFTATLPGWYELSFDFDWKYEMTNFREVAYDSNNPIWNGDTLLGSGQKILIEEPDQLFYKVEFNAQICEPNDTVRKNYKLYTIENNGNGVKWFKGDGSNKNKIPMESLRSYVNGLAFDSTEYEERNKEEGTTMVAENGYTFGRPVNKKFVVYLYSGDKVRLQSRGTAYCGYTEEGSNHAWEFNFRKSNSTKHYAPQGSLIWLSSRPDHKLFDAKLIDKIGPYRTLDPSLFYDVKTKQTDFFNSLVKMFNLYIEDVSYKKIHEDGTDIFPNNTLRIEPRPIYYNIGKNNWQSNAINEKYSKKIVDFTEYVDFSTISYKRPDDYLYTNLVFKMKDDSSDYFSKMYKDKTLSTFGELNIKAIYVSTESDNNVDMIFSNTTNGSSSCQHDPDFNVAIPCIFSLNDKGEVNTGYTSAMRLLNKYTQTARTPKVYYDSSSYLSGGNGTPILSVFDDVTAQWLDPAEYRYGYNRLEFGTREYYLEKFTEPNNHKISNTDLFNAFYLNEYSQITAADARILSCKCYIPSTVINDLKLSHSILIDGIIYYINKISNWTSGDEPCDCEFLKFGPYSFYDEYINNPTPSDFTLETIGVSTAQDSSGNTTVNSTTNNYTVINQTTIGSSDNYTIGENGGNITLYKNGVSHTTAQLPTFAGSGRGYVPQSSGESNKYLAADGTWKTVSGGSGNLSLDIGGMEGDELYLEDNGSVISTVQLPTMTGALSQSDGYPGLVPKPRMGDYQKFLRGDGTWQQVGGSQGGNYSLGYQQNIFGAGIQLLDNGVTTSTATVPWVGLNTAGVVRGFTVQQDGFYLRNDGWHQVAEEYNVLLNIVNGIEHLEGDYSTAIQKLQSGIAVNFIINNNNSGSYNTTEVYQAVMYNQDDGCIYFHRSRGSWGCDVVELYSDNSYDFYGNETNRIYSIGINGSNYYSQSSTSNFNFVQGDGVSMTRNSNAATISMKTASNQEIGGIKVSSTVAPSAGTVLSTGMRRPVQVDANGNASVLVDIAPSYSAGTGLSLSGTTFSLNQATNSTLGGIKVSSTQASTIGSISTQGTVRPVQLDANGVAGVTIPDIISPLHLTNSGITCKAADIEESTYRLGEAFLDYEKKNYTERAGTVTPVNCVDTDKNGVRAIEAWHDLGTLFESLKGEFLIPGPKSRSVFYALPVVTLRTSHGSVPVVLVNKRIYDQLDNYVVDENASIIVQ